MSVRVNANLSSASFASTDIVFTDIRIEVPWGHLSGRWYGNREIRPLLALHGWLDNIGTWEKLIPLLPKHIGVLCIDFPGHGHSSKYPTGMIYHTIDFAHVIGRVMKEYNWQKVSLLAHSLGSLASFLFTALFPNKVDMLIAIDLVYPRCKSYPNMKQRIDDYRQNIEKNLLLDEQLTNFPNEEPPSYTYAELEKKLYEGSNRSLELQNCKYILDRSIDKSSKFPEKYFFSRDPKLKYYIKMEERLDVLHTMAKSIKNLPYLIIRGSRSRHINLSDHEELFGILRKNNAHFEFHQIDGTHHVHVNNASDVAAIVNPFIMRHRPDTLDSWALNDNEKGSENIKSKINLRHNFKKSQL